MRILAYPRDPNPYQGLLYREMQHLGAEVSYLGQLTPSRTLNLLLLPVEVAVRRMVGARLIHLHWVFTFTFPGSQRFSVMRQVAYVWFLGWLRVCRMLGVHLVWTAHNVLPHTPVFADDVAARRALVEASDLVLAHSESALTELTALGAIPHRSAVISHGPVAPARPAAPRAAPATGRQPRRFLFFGRVQHYKGVDDLLVAFLTVLEEVSASLTVAGQCDDPQLRSRLHALARQGGSAITLRLERIPEEEVSQLLGASDVVVLPFRQVTTSGSAMLALSHGRPLIVPALPGLADLPDQAVLRYNWKSTALADALKDLACADAKTVAAMSAAARDYAFSITWQEIAEKTIAEMLSVLGGNPATRVPGGLLRVP
jgi:glycosyltransferase involved in cell wall biosynthesis